MRARGLAWAPVSRWALPRLVLQLVALAAKAAHESAFYAQHHNTAGTAVGGPQGVAGQQAPENDDSDVAPKDTEAEKHNLLPSAPPAKHSQRDTPFPEPLPYEGSGQTIVCDR